MIRKTKEMKGDKRQENRVRIKDDDVKNHKNVKTNKQSKDFRSYRHKMHGYLGECCDRRN